MEEVVSCIFFLAIDFFILLFFFFSSYFSSSSLPEKAPAKKSSLLTSQASLAMVASTLGCRLQWRSRRAIKAKSWLLALPQGGQAYRLPSTGQAAGDPLPKPASNPIRYPWPYPSHHSPIKDGGGGWAVPIIPPSKMGGMGGRRRDEVAPPLGGGNRGWGADPSHPPSKMGGNDGGIGGNGRRLLGVLPHSQTEWPTFGGWPAVPIPSHPPSKMGGGNDGMGIGRAYHPILPTAVPIHRTPHQRWGGMGWGIGRRPS